MLSVSDLNLMNKRVLVRADLNVPMEHGEITDDTRIQRALKTIRLIHEKGGKVILLSHLGRPKEGSYDPNFSLKPVADHLSILLNEPVVLIKDWVDGFDFPAQGIVLCENVRFQAGEKQNDLKLAQKIAALGDIFVMDAFGTAHRKHASTYGVAEYSLILCAGTLLLDEINNLEQVTKNPKRPLVAVVGGAKVSGKLELLNHLITMVDVLIVGGGIANTFLEAKGYKIGESLSESDLVTEAKNVLINAKETSTHIPLPLDVLVVKEIAESANSKIKAIDALNSDDKIVDVGPETIQLYDSILKSAQTIIWNGPVGIFEMDAYAKGTHAIAKAIASSAAYSIAGGGDTLAALEKFNLKDKVSYLSTGGGAFLEFLQGDELPGIAVLNKS